MIVRKFFPVPAGTKASIQYNGFLALFCMTDFDHL